MTMSEKERGRIAALIIKRIKGRTDAVEDGRLETWAALSAENRQLLDEMLETDTLIRQLLQYKKPDLPAAWEKLVLKIPALRSVPGPRPVSTHRWRIGRRHWMAIAAVIVVAAALGIYLNYSSSRPPAAGQPPDHATAKDASPAMSAAHTNDLMPAVQKLTITLPGGDSLDVVSVPEKGMVIYDHLSIRRGGIGTLVYDQTSAASAKGAENKVATPSGGWYNIVLPDGTRVRLNPASSLRFPTSFGWKERKVILTGEAYFEVAHKTSAPFTVLVKKAQDMVSITAKGTSFNVTAYVDDGFIRTTMLQGNVSIKDPASATPINVRAGQQYVQYLDGNNDLQNRVDTLQAVGWKSDLFVFKGESLPEVMRQISRWYDAKVEYRETPVMRIALRSPRSGPLSGLLKMIEEIGDVHFKIEDHRIIVSH